MGWLVWDQRAAAAASGQHLLFGWNIKQQHPALCAPPHANMARSANHLCMALQVTNVGFLSAPVPSSAAVAAASAACMPSTACFALSLIGLLENYPGPIAAMSAQFPDPHFKKRHKKRRMVQPSVVQTARERLMPGGMCAHNTGLGSRRVD
jgi:hypothetical protein